MEAIVLTKEKLEVLTIVNATGFSFCYESYFIYIYIYDRSKHLLNRKQKKTCNNDKNSVKLHYGYPFEKLISEVMDYEKENKQIKL